MANNNLQMSETLHINFQTWISPPSPSNVIKKSSVLVSPGFRNTLFFLSYVYHFSERLQPNFVGGR